MRRRSSEIADEDKSRDSPQENGEKKQSFTSIKHDVSRHSDSFDRRRAEKAIVPLDLVPNGSVLSDAQESRKKVLLLATEQGDDKMLEARGRWRSRPQNQWSCSLLTLFTTAAAMCLLSLIVHSFLTRQIDSKGCDMCYTREMFYFEFADFDTEHTRFARKYSLHLLRERGFDEDPKVKGVPVLFVPGNAGSYKQARCLASEAAQFYASGVQQDLKASKEGIASLDFFAVDFNEDFTAFHGQTLLDQAEYLNDAVAYILSLYHDPRRAQRDPNLPDPSSVILVGHSMGGVVARTMLTMSNYQPNSINTIITMSAPHARPPASFDADIVRAYRDTNRYWREAYSQKWANNNPLWHVTLISIAGGGLDNIVPSDYASISSLIPATHGFTVFTSSIPNMWTGADHIQMTWCVQLMKATVRSIYETLNVHRPSQTKPRAERMRIFKKWFLTGMEAATEKTLSQREPTTLLTLEDNSNSILPSGERLVLREFGKIGKPKAHLLPIPRESSPGTKKFTLLSNEHVDEVGSYSRLEVFFCSIFPLQAGQSAILFSMDIDLSDGTSGSTRLACKNAASDIILLPASTKEAAHAYDKNPPFSYFEYHLEDLAEHQYVAVIEKASELSKNWVFAEFSDKSYSVMQANLGLRRLLTFGLRVRLPTDRPMVSDVQIPAIHSSLLTFKLTLDKQACNNKAELFTPLLRQYLTEPHESRYFVNVKQANISLHGLAPFMPPPLRSQAFNNGISLRFWTDPTCNSSIDMSLKVDTLGSMGKLVMRYRMVFAAFPLLVVALVLRKQFQIYDDNGVFITFLESIGLCLRSSLPLLMLALTFLATSLAISSSSAAKVVSTGQSHALINGTESVIDFTKNDLLLGSQDPIFWVLVPLCGLLGIGVCIVINYVSLGVTWLSCMLYKTLARGLALTKYDNGRITAVSGFAASSARRRIITTSVLLLLVSTFIPYQFAYLDACIVQLATCTRALRLAKDTRSGTHYNFYNYAHSTLMLMLCVLPINVPVLIVWVHNLAVQWLTPFSSHHNVLSIMPFLILVETQTCGKMIPRVISKLRYITNLLFFSLAVFAAVYGVTYAYLLHHFANFIAAWFVAVHFSGTEFSLHGLTRILESEDGGDGGDVKKRP